MSRRTCGDYACVLFYFAREAAGAAEAPGIPCALCFRKATMCLQNSGESSREKAKVWLLSSSRRSSPLPLWDCCEI